MIKVIEEVRVKDEIVDWLCDEVWEYKDQGTEIIKDNTVRELWSGFIDNAFELGKKPFWKSI